MKRMALLAGTAAVALPAIVLGAPAPLSSVGPTPLVSSPLGGGSSSHDRAIRRAFEDVLDREPSYRELWRYRDLMEDDDWTEADVRDDLRDRHDDRHGRRGEDPDRIVRRAYDDILHRAPDSDGLRLYRSRIIDDDWTESDVREALRKSPEYRKRSAEVAEEVVRRSYQDLLGREPDAAGLRTYRDRILRDDWDEKDVREALRKSPEYREKGPMTRARAEEVVRGAYQSVLGREPDGGSRGYVDRVLRDGWTEEDVARELRKSPEYRSRKR
jgi:Domain of unknown function (DUF4214)